MTNLIQRWVSYQRLRATLMLLLGAGCVVGCDSSGGMSHLEQMQLSQQGAADALTKKGATVAKKQYPQGEAWGVDLSGGTIDEDVITHLGSLVLVSELDLSGTNVTDEQLATLVATESISTLIKINLSDTAVTDTGLQELAKLHLVFEIDVKGSKVTPQGIEQYKAKRPKHPFGLALKVAK